MSKRGKINSKQKGLSCEKLAGMYADHFIYIPTAVEPLITKCFTKSQA